MKFNPIKMFMILHINIVVSFGHRDVLVMYVVGVMYAEPGRGDPVFPYCSLSIPLR